MPGPLFNFAAYLGAIIAINAGYFWLTGVAVAWFGLFGPGVALMFAVLPFWQRFRGWQVTCPPASPLLTRPPSCSPCCPSGRGSVAGR